jgi:hypothetical protein
MERNEISISELEEYFDGKKHRAGYKKCVKLYKDLKVHADGEFPEHLIHERRPNESARIQKYRRDVYKAITKSVVQRVLTSLTKIRRSVDWGIIHPIEKYPDSIPPSERLNYYTEKGFPMIESFEDWMFTIAFRNYILDANGVVLWLPYNRDAAENEYLQPVPMIFNSECVLEYEPNELLIAKIDSYKKDKREQKFITADQERIQKWKRTDGGYEMVWEYEHQLGMMPAFVLGGMYRENIGYDIIRESRISPMLERLDEAAREYSDMQAEVVQHIHSERWQWATQNCTKCANDAGVSTGFINDDKNNKKITCPSCNGARTVAGSPYVNMVVRPSKESMGEQAAPIPPAGYITKETNIVEIQDRRIDEHIYKALSAINMQFLDQTPLNNSGKAKEVDRDELNNFVYGVAHDMVRIAKLSMRIMGEYRHNVIIKDAAARMELQPDIRVPQKFDLLSSSYLADEIAAAKSAKMNPVVIAALEREFAAKKFYNDPAVRDMLVLAMELDPLAAITEDDKMLRKANKGITEIDYIISSNITEMVRDAMQDEKFQTSSREEQLAILRSMADAKRKAINAAVIEVAENTDA